MSREWTPALIEQRRIFDRLKLPYHILNQAELQARYPQINVDDIAFGFLETSQTAAIIRAQDATVQVQELLRRKGGRSMIGRVMPGKANGRTLLTLAMNNDEEVQAGQFVFACGPWSPKTLPGAMATKVRVKRFEYHYWGLPTGDDRFAWPNQPAWHDHTTGGYGFGSLGRGIKYSPGGPPRDIDVDTSDRLPNPESLAKCRAYMAHRFPALKDAPVVGANVCQTEMTVSDDFIIDRHPDYDNVWIASGGGGHAFKFGPMIGDHVADLVTGKAVNPEMAALFAYASKSDID
jgi:sarcosine oxidase